MRTRPRLRKKSTRTRPRLRKKKTRTEKHRTRLEPSARYETILPGVFSAGRQASVWGPVASLSQPRFFLGGVNCNGRIFAVRGIPQLDYWGDEDTPVEEYDRDADRWNERSVSVPLGADAFARAPGRMVVAADGIILSIGGCQRTPHATVDTVETYDPARNLVLYPPTIPRACEAAGAVAKDRKIYVIGGWHSPPRGGDWSMISDVQCYDLTTNSWQAKAPLSAPRAELAAVAGSDGKIYAIGGLAGSGERVATVEAYDPATNTWSIVAPMHVPRGALAAVEASDGMIYAIGGIPFYSPTNAVEKYDPTRNVWANTDPLLTSRFGHAAVATDDGKIYAIGGATKHIYRDTTRFEVLATVEMATVPLR